MNFKKAIFLLLFFSQLHFVWSQELNTITTAVPFASIIANAQSMGTGGVGVVASDLNIQNGLDQNPAILSRGKKVMGFQLNYVPWLRDQIPEINLYELGYYHSIRPNHTLGFSARYFVLDEINFTDNTGTYIATAQRSEERRVGKECS